MLRMSKKKIVRRLQQKVIKNNPVLWLLKVDQLCTLTYYYPIDFSNWDEECGLLQSDVTLFRSQTIIYFGRYNLRMKKSNRKIQTEKKKLPTTSTL